MSDEEQDVGLPVKFFMDAKTGVVSEVQIMLPFSKELVCDCDVASVFEMCDHLELTALEVEETGGLLPISLAGSVDEDVFEELGTTLDLRDTEAVAKFRSILMRHSYIEVV